MGTKFARGVSPPCVTITDTFSGVLYNVFLRPLKMFSPARKTAIAIDTIINQKRFNDAEDDSECHC